MSTAQSTAAFRLPLRLARAGRQEQIFLTLEVRVDGPDGEAALADDVLNAGPLVAEATEDVDRRVDDAVADRLLVFVADFRHSTIPRRTAVLHILALTTTTANRGERRNG
jgi:hypothetical protein